MRTLRLAGALGALALAAGLSLAWYKPATNFGPPFLSLEVPANPLDPATRGAAFTVRSYHHDRAIARDLNATAEGVVDGRRRSIPVELRAARQPGVYAVTQTWPAEGQWIIAITQGEGATLVVEMGEDGGIRPSRYYGQASAEVSLRSVRVLEKGPTTSEINRSLSALAVTN